ncbi:hypothetical protein [Nocardia australiensis]|uniref:hypothetical protein n=1 Tax=Nocardia australiensis TaxID=2887191 RepID=UPI001D13E642|nr:hypothetical protein [Nocardia australiensis]
MPDESNWVPAPDSDEFDSESRWIAWKGRFARAPIVEEEPAEPFGSPRAFGKWSAATNASRLVTRVEHISDLADDLFQELSDVAEPVNQLTEDVRAVQFWRFRRGGSRK